MDILEELLNEVKGSYSKGFLKKVNTPSGTFIAQNSN